MDIEKLFLETLCIALGLIVSCIAIGFVAGTVRFIIFMIHG